MEFKNINVQLFFNLKIFETRIFSCFWHFVPLCIDPIIHPSPGHPLCGVEERDTEHIFNCKSIPGTQSPDSLCLHNAMRVALLEALMTAHMGATKT